MARALLSGLLLSLTPAVSAVEVSTRVLNVCIAEADIPPFSYATYESTLLQQVRLTAQRQGWEVTFTTRPWLRCRAEVASGKYDVLVPVAPGRENSDTFVFPGRKGEPDPALALGTVRVVAAQKLGSNVSWDGQRFTGLHGPVISLRGMNALSEYLTLIGVPSVGASSPRDMMHMLLAGRSNLVVDIEYRMHQTLEEPEFRERFQVLPTAVLTLPVYLVASPPFYRLHKDVVERLWHDTAGLGENSDSGSHNPINGNL